MNDKSNDKYDFVLVPIKGMWKPDTYTAKLCLIDLAGNISKDKVVTFRVVK